jgi:hypothetical protein
MTTQAWYKRGLNRKAGGPILGKRGGITRNIGLVATEDYFNNLRAARLRNDPGRRDPRCGNPDEQAISETNPSVPQSTVALDNR